MSARETLIAGDGRGWGLDLREGAEGAASGAPTPRADWTASSRALRAMRASPPAAWARAARVSSAMSMAAPAGARPSVALEGAACCAPTRAVGAPVARGEALEP